MTDLLAEAKALLEKATKGPIVRLGHVEECVIGGFEAIGPEGRPPTAYVGSPDADLYAWCRTGVPALIKMVERLQLIARLVDAGERRGNSLAERKMIANALDNCRAHGDINGG